MSIISKQITRERFDTWYEELAKRHGVPMLIICAGIEEGHALYGQMFCINSQGKSIREMIDLLRATADEIERNLQ